METTIVGLSYDISVESTYSKHGPVWLVLYVRNSRLRSRYGAWGRRHWRVKYPRCRRSKRCSYILWKGLYRNIRYICIILEANIIWRFGYPIRLSFLLDFYFLRYTCRRVLMVDRPLVLNSFLQEHVKKTPIALPDGFYFVLAVCFPSNKYQ